MKKKIALQKMLPLLGGIFLMCCGNINAQQNPVFGKVGDVTIDQHFISSLQLLYPGFAFTGNADAFKKSVFKNYVDAKARADVMKQQPVYKSAELQKQIEQVKQMAEEKFLANLYTRSQTDSTIPVSDAEAKNYYDTHIAQFTQPGQYSFFTAFVADTVKYPVKEVVARIKQYALVVTDQFKTGDKSSYSVTYDKNLTIPANDFIYPVLSKLKPGEYTVVANGDNGIIIYQLQSKTPETVIPFSKVKEQCAGNVVSEKRANAEQQFIDNAMQKYPVTLNKDLFGK